MDSDLLEIAKVKMNAGANTLEDLLVSKPVQQNRISFQCPEPMLRGLTSFS